MAQPERPVPNQPPEAAPSRISSQLTQGQLSLLTGLALVDGSNCLGDQIRSALAAYDEEPYELRFRLSPASRYLFSNHPERTINGRRVAFSLTSEELAQYDRLKEKATQEGLHSSVGLFAILGKYIDDRLGDSRTGVMAREAIRRLRPEPGEALPSEGPSSH